MSDEYRFFVSIHSLYPLHSKSFTAQFIVRMRIIDREKNWEKKMS